MNLLDQLEAVIEQEHLAMLQWDWHALERCVAQKDSLAQQLAKGELQAGDHDHARRIRQAARHNVELAASISQQLSGLLSVQQSSSTYDSGGRVAHRRHVMMSYRG